MAGANLQTSPARAAHEIVRNRCDRAGFAFRLSPPVLVCPGGPCLLGIMVRWDVRRVDVILGALRLEQGTLHGLDVCSKGGPCRGAS